MRCQTCFDEERQAENRLVLDEDFELMVCDNCAEMVVSVEAVLYTTMRSITGQASGPLPWD